MENHQAGFGDAKGKKVSLGDILKKKGGKPGVGGPQPAAAAKGTPSPPQKKAPAAGKAAAKMDFEAFRKQKLQEQKAARGEESGIDHERYHFEKGLAGTGEKYQDHRIGDGPQEMEGRDPAEALKYQDHKLGDGVQQRFDHATTGQGKAYHDHRLGDGVSEAGSVQGQGEKYQDHRLGNALKHDILDSSAGQGKKYHDHRLGEGIKVQEEEPEEESQE